MYSTLAAAGVALAGVVVAASFIAEEPPKVPSPFRACAFDVQ